MTNKLILHFDARNTLFVADFNSRLTIEKALNTYISGLVWGSVVDDVWTIGDSDLSINCPDKSFVSFYKYMENKMVKNINDRLQLREVLGNFTQTNESPFEAIFLKHLQLLEWTYDYHEYFTVKGSGDKLYHYIMPTFFNTIRILHRKNRNFAIIIRSFGLDIPFIINSIKAFINGEHPMYPGKLNIRLCSVINTLTKNTSSNEYLYNFVTNDADVPKTTNEEAQIVQHWNSIEGIAAVKDDFNYWLSNNYHYSASKPLWIDYSSKNSTKICHHIFFDDCIHASDSDSIVHLRKLKMANGETPSDNGCSGDSYILNPGETEKYINVNLVQSELLECIRNHNYFIEKIEFCENKFSQMYC